MLDRMPREKDCKKPKSAWWQYQEAAQARLAERQEASIPIDTDKVQRMAKHTED